MPAFRHLRHLQLGASAAILAIASTGAIAVAATTTTLATGKATVKGKTSMVVVDPRGRTLYTLSGETARHLKCTSKSCLKAWPPYKVSADEQLTEGEGVHGKVGRVHRGGFYQVTLNGRPLYFFVGDHRAGVANGQALVSAGGTWRVVSP